MRRIHKVTGLALEVTPMGFLVACGIYGDWRINTPCNAKTGKPLVTVQNGDIVTLSLKIRTFEEYQMELDLGQENPVDNKDPADWWKGGFDRN